MYICIGLGGAGLGVGDIGLLVSKLTNILASLTNTCDGGVAPGQDHFFNRKTKTIESMDALHSTKKRQYIYN